MLSIAVGHDVGYLTGPVAAGRENYYTGAVADGEPPGRWFGAGAAELGLSGVVDGEMMEALYTHLLDPRDPAAGARDSWGEAAPLCGGHRQYRTPDDIYEGLLEAEPGAGPERRAELRVQAEASARQAVQFLDATFSAPKSVTVLGVAFERAAAGAAAAGDEVAAAGWAAHARAVEEAVLAGATAALEYLQDEAGYSRVGHHGGGSGRWIDAHRFVVAQFLQHDSRDRDPQLHVHQAILNRVLCADGVWRALDSRAIHNLRAAAAAIGERVMEAHLARSVGARVETRPDGRSREVIGVRPAVVGLFSSRRRAITVKAQELVDAYAARYGREPNALQRTRLSLQATLATRRAKSHDGETTEERLARWDTELRAEVGSGLTQVAHDVLALRQDAGPVATWSVRDVLDRAIARAAGESSSFSRSDLMRAISDELPAHLGVAPQRVRELLDRLTDEALTMVVRNVEETDTSDMPEELRLADGRAAYEGPQSVRYSTRGQLAAELALRAAAVERGAVALPAAQAAAAVAASAESGRELGVDQAAAVRGVLTSGARVEVLCAAAGTGKSFVVGVLAQAWTSPGPDPGPESVPPAGRRVFGLAPSEVAAQVLAGEGLTAAANTTVWLAAQRRLDAAPPGAPDRFGDGRWRLRAGDLVVVDEAGMASTADLTDIRRRCEAADAKLLLVGDPRQLGAVGPGGALADVADHGLRYDLAEVRRFTADWEGPASLRLRDGDPTALTEYHKHGRLLDGGTVEQTEAGAARAWLADTLAGRDSLLLVGANEAAARVSASVRAQLVELGHVTETGVPLRRPEWEGVLVGVGDLVLARRNAHDLLGWEGNTSVPLNQQTFRVTAVRDDGGLTVARVHGPALPTSTDGGPAAAGSAAGDTLQLPPAYVAEHVTLGYAATVHAAQGRTVDTTHAVVGAGGDAAATYVALTRGRDCNTAHAVTRSAVADTPTGDPVHAVQRTARTVVADILTTLRGDRSAAAEREQAQLDADSTRTHVDRLIDGVALATAGRTAATLDDLTTGGVITDSQRRLLAADEAMGSLDQLLRTAELAGHDPAAVLTAAAADDRGLHHVRSPARVLHHRITAALAGRLTPRITSAADLIPRGLTEVWSRWAQRRAADADTRRHELGAEIAADPPRWAVDALGPVPDTTAADPAAAAEAVVARQEWEHRAGWAGAWRELAGHTDDTEPLGPAPGRGLSEKRALFRTGHQALGLLDAAAEEAEMSDGQLRARHRALAREEAWAPRFVDEDLAAIHQEAAKAEADYRVWLARAAVTADPAEQARLRSAAYTARQTAGTLTVRAEAVEEADRARGAWYAHTAVTRDNAIRARAELAARGVDPDDPTEQTTAAEWLDAHRAAQLAEDADRVIGDHDIHDDTHTADVVADATGAETAVADIRDTAPDPTETADPATRHRVPDVYQVTADVARAQAALAEITTRQAAEAEHTARIAAEAARREQLTRWAEHDDTVAAAARDVEPAAER
ncbi:MAG: MobF family relaxase [Pseudonocardia sp.]